MPAIREVVVVGVVALVTSGGLVAPATAQGQDAEREVYETGAELDYRFRTARFVGTISSGFTDDDTDVPGCLAGRQVTILFRRADGSRRLVGTTSTTQTGSFRLRAALRKGVYIARVEAREFAYSPSYGRLVEVVCAAGSTRMKSTRARVLGLRLERGGTEGKRGTARLPFTGWHRAQGAVLPLGAGMVLLGALLLMISSRRPSATAPQTWSLRRGASGSLHP